MLRAPWQIVTRKIWQVPSGTHEPEYPPCTRRVDMTNSFSSSRRKQETVPIVIRQDHRASKCVRCGAYDIDGQLNTVVHVADGPDVDVKCPTSWSLEARQKGCIHTDTHYLN